MRLVLASGSAARAAMLRAAGVAFEQLALPVDEAGVREALKAERVTAEDAAMLLAELKGQRVAAGIAGEAIVLGADQLLELEGEWLEKPADRAVAKAQLLRLSGRRHRLVSAAVGLRNGARVWHHVGVASLWVRPLSEGFVEEYLDAVGEAVLQSVGSYQLEGPGAQLMARVEGDFFTVLGLPLLPVLQFLRDQGVLRA
ncbi:MAG TPA: Maf family protein [Geminicoccaceae bacterium]|nr:Maf family protein [Geminicoccaceae bacterium]